jgi:hypothetical protein
VGTSCNSAYALPTGTTYDAVIAYSSNQPPTLTSSGRVVGPSTYNGNAAIELSGTVSPTPQLSSRSFGVFNASTGVETTFGSIVRITLDASSMSEVTTIDTPATEDKRYGLSVGQSFTQVSAQQLSSVTTFNGVALPPTTQTISTTKTITYLGQEVVTVPAGTFNTCKYSVVVNGTAGTETDWLMVGYGAQVKAIDTSGVTSTLISLKVNGVAKTQYP